MSVLLFASATLALLAPPTITVNLQDGETLHGERAFRVYANTDTAIGKVEFYVNGELRDTDESTPFEFKLDTVSEADGPLKLRFKAVTVENKSAEKSFNIQVDNEVGKGAAYHVAKANDLLTDSKFADARDEGRIAMKADKNDFNARIALARAYIGLGEYDKAQLQAEEAKSAKPNDPGALTLLSGIRVRQAFRIVGKPGGDRAATMKDIKDGLSSAASDRNAALAATLDTLKPEGATLLPYADAALRAGRYALVVTTLAPAFDKDQKNVALADRLAYAQVRLNRLQDATNTLNTLARSTPLDAYGLALRAVILADKGDDAGSDAAIKDAILSDSENLGVQTAQAFIALKRGKTDVLSRLSADLSKDQGQRPDVRYFQMALAAKQQRYGDADKAFQVGVLAEPAMADLYVEYANDAIAIAQRSTTMDAKEKTNHYEEARAYFETALAARPEASEALSGLAMVALFENKPAEAVRYAEAAVAAAPGDAGAYYALAAAQAVTQNPKAQANSRKAGQLDPRYLGGRTTPDAVSVWRYLDSAGRPTVIAAPSA